MSIMHYLCIWTIPETMHPCRALEGRDTKYQYTMQFLYNLMPTIIEALLKRI